MEKNNDGGSEEAERKIRVVEFMGQKTAQPEWGHGRKLLDDVTYSVVEKEEELFQESKVPEVIFLLYIQVTDSWSLSNVKVKLLSHQLRGLTTGLEKMWLFDKLSLRFGLVCC